MLAKCMCNSLNPACRGVKRIWFRLNDILSTAHPIFIDQLKSLYYWRFRQDRHRFSLIYLRSTGYLLKHASVFRARFCDVPFHIFTPPCYTGHGSEIKSLRSSFGNNLSRIMALDFLESQDVVPILGILLISGLFLAYYNGETRRVCVLSSFRIRL